MDSLNHLKNNYRPRYFNRDGPKQAINLQGENVLKYIQGCFETCANGFTAYSPTITCSSPSSSERDQDEDPFNSKEKEQPVPQLHLQNAFNTICLPSPNKNNRCPGENVSEDGERLNTSHFLEDDDIDVASLGSPALLLVDEQCEEMLHSGEDAFMSVVNLEKGGDVTESEMCHARTETKEPSIEETKCSAACFSHKKMSEPLTLEAMTTSFTQRNAANAEPEDDCEFLIEESFGVSSTSWILASQKNQKPQKKSLKSVPSGQKKGANQRSVTKKDKRPSEKIVTPSPVKQAKMKLTNVAEATIDGVQNVSRTNEIMSLVDDQPLLVLNTTEEGRQKIHSEGKVSEEASNKISTSINQTEDCAALLEENSVSVLSPILSVEPAEQMSSNKKPQPAEEKLSNKKPQPAEEKLSNKKTQPAEQKLSNKNSQPAEQKLSNKKPLKRQKSQRTAGSKKQPETQRSTVEESVIRATRRKKRVLVSDESSETEHEDEQYSKGFENLCSYKLSGITHSRKASKKKRLTSLVGSEDTDYGSVSSQEDSFEQYLTEKRLHSSMKQQNGTKDSLQSAAATDVNMNNFSGPVDNNKTSSKLNVTFDAEELSSDESGDFMESLDGFVPNALKHKLVLPTNTPNVRRTKRMRIKPLEYWRGERVEYKTRPSGGFVVHGIISPEQKEPRKPKPKKKEQPFMELGNMPDDAAVSLKKLSEPAVVFDAETNEEVLLECVNGGGSHLFFIHNETVSIYKYLTTPSFSAGKMILKPLKEKGYQYSHTDTLVFHISCGKLLLTLYDQHYCLTVGDYFFIPPGNVYNIRNLLNKECVILFTQLKGKRSES